MGSGRWSSRCCRRYDAGKKTNGRNRFIVTDTLGLLLTVVVVTAGRQDRDGARPVLPETYLRTPVRFVFADGAFAGRLLDWASTILRTTLHIVRKPHEQRGFAVIPRRWAVERTFTWLTAHQMIFSNALSGLVHRSDHHVHNSVHTFRSVVDVVEAMAAGYSPEAPTAVAAWTMSTTKVTNSSASQ